MATVQTVLGPIELDQLGPTLVHEHVRISYPGDELDPTSTWDRATCVETSVQRMHGLMEHGVRTFVDPCPIELGRDPELLAEVARTSGMNIVCSTGFYHEHDAIGLPYYWRSRTTDEIAEFYLHEIRNGIGETGIRPGVIKIASGDPPTDLERKFIAAAAIAAVESGLPIVSHCENAMGFDVQQDVLEAGGMDLSRCVIGHQVQGEQDVADQLAIVARGSFVGIDRIGFELLAPDERRADAIKTLVDNGHAERVCLSQDHSCCLRSARFPYPIPAEMADYFRENLEPGIREQMYARPHTFLFTDFIPRLEARGIDRATVDSMLTDNPRRLFGG